MISLAGRRHSEMISLVGRKFGFRECSKGPLSTGGLPATTWSLRDSQLFHSLPSICLVFVCVCVCVRWGKGVCERGGRVLREERERERERESG